MKQKRKDYFFAGVALVWFVDPRRRTVSVYTAPDACTILQEGTTLDGGTVLPGFTLAVSRIFERLPAEEPPVKKKRKKQ